MGIRVRKMMMSDCSVNDNYFLKPVLLIAGLYSLWSIIDKACDKATKHT